MKRRLTGLAQPHSNIGIDLKRNTRTSAGGAFTPSAQQMVSGRTQVSPRKATNAARVTSLLTEESKPSNGNLQSPTPAQTAKYARMKK